MSRAVRASLVPDLERSLVDCSGGRAIHIPRNRALVARASVSGVHSDDPHLTLGVARDASEQEIRKAYRRLALQFHPDVCNGESSAAQFMQINQAYKVALDPTKDEEDRRISMDYCTEGMMGINDNTWEDWEEWMGWEGAGIRDYSSHINCAL